jgi:hypothetical protein
MFKNILKKQLSSLIAYGIIGFSVITAISLLFVVGGLNNIAKINVNFPLIAFVSFILFVVVVGLRYRELTQESKNIVNIQPAVTIRPVIEKDRFYLEVINTGDVAATFVATLKISSKQAKEIISQDLREYTGSWKLANARESKIMKGQSDKLRIAELQTTNFPIVAIHLRAYIYENEYKVTREIALQSYFPLAVVTHADGKSGPMSRPEYQLEVAFSSDPSLKECPLKKNYILSISGLEEVQIPVETISSIN